MVYLRRKSRAEAFATVTSFGERLRLIVVVSGTHPKSPPAPENTPRRAGLSLRKRGTYLFRRSWYYTPLLFYEEKGSGDEF